MDETFHLRPYYRNLGLLGICGSIAMAAGTVYVAMTDVPQDALVYFLCFCLGVSTFFLGGSLYLLLGYWKFSLTFRYGRLIENRIVRQKEIALATTDALHWRHLNNVVVQSGAARIKIELENFTVEERLRIIRHLRQSVPATVQVGWPMFCHRFALPLARRDRPLRPEQGDFVFTPARWDRLLFPFTAGAVVLAALAWWLLDFRRGWLVPLQIGALWLYLRIMTPPNGFVYRGSEPPKEASRYIRFAAIWGLVGFVAMFGVIVLGAIESIPAVAGLMVFTVLWLAGFIWLLHWADLARQRQADEQAPISAEDWERHFSSAAHQ
jgi:hypothetical protein